MNQGMYYKAEEMLHKASQKKHGEHSSILARWLNDYKYKKSLSDVGWTEQDIRFFATRAERLRNSEHWILELNQDGAAVKSTTRLCSSEKRMQEIKRLWQGLSRNVEPFLEATK